MRTKVYLFQLVIGLLIIAGCSQDDKKVTTAPVAAKKIDFVEPFRFHKLIEVSPGQYYDVLSWGRGSASAGSYLILHSDSSGKKYTTTTGDLDGTIVDVYNADMDLDGNPEILIQAKAKDTTNYATIYAFEFNGSKAQKLDFPKLNALQKKGYRGNDNFYIKEGKFIREFPIYTGNGKDTKTTGQKRQLEYGLRNNSFTVKQLSKDSVDKSPVKQSVVSAAPQKVVAKKETTSAKKSKKHTIQKKHKKKKHHRRRHHTDDE